MMGALVLIPAFSAGAGTSHILSLCSAAAAADDDDDGGGGGDKASWLK